MSARNVRRGFPLEQLVVRDEEGDDDIDVCMGCGRYYGSTNHRGLQSWTRDPNWPNEVAPQLCMKCWREQGYFVEPVPAHNAAISGKPAASEPSNTNNGPAAGFSAALAS